MKSFLKCYLKTLFELVAIVVGGTCALFAAGTIVSWVFSDDPLKQFGGLVLIILIAALIVTWVTYEPDHGDCEELAHGE